MPTFIEDYLNYSMHNEAPLMFHVWGGFVCISAAVSRKVWLPFGDRVIYPNIYVMYVGEAGNGKSEALYRPKAILTKLDNIHISRSVETPEGLTRFMAGDKQKDPPLPSVVRQVVTWPDGELREIHPMTIIANEFINFINKNQEGWTAFLNDIYDEDRYEYRTKNQGEDNLIGPYIVLLGALTTEVSADLQKARIISTGFARRTIFQYGERRWEHPHAIPEDDPQIKSAKAACVAHAKRIQSAKGAFFWSQETQAWWTRWYDIHTRLVPSRPGTVRSWYASKPHQVLKLAMLLSLSEDNELVINTNHLQGALDYLEVMEADLHKVFGGVGRNELAAVVLKMEDSLKQFRVPITVAEFRSSFFNSLRAPNDWDACFKQLQDIGTAVVKQMAEFSPTIELLATPPVMQAFSQAYALAQVQPAVAAQLLSQMAAVRGIDPLIAQLKLRAGS